MLIASLAWVLLFGASWGYGRLAYRRSVAIDAQPTAELIASEIYLGILIIGGILLAVSLRQRLVWWMGLLVMGPGLVMFYRQRRRMKYSFRKVQLWGGLLLLMLVALFTSSREITYYDTGLYHQQAVKWLSGYGLVRGLALLHFRLGFASSWFALAAPFNDFFAGRAAAIVGGVPFVFMAFLIAGTAQRWMRGRPASLLSLSWLLFCAGLSVVATTWNLETSLSPDLTIWLLPIVVATTLSDPGPSSGARVSTSCLLVGLACLLKLMALPILLYVLAIVVPSAIRTMSWRERIKSLAFLLATAMVGAAAYLRLSGCPAFPSAYFCQEGPSAVGPRVAETVGALMAQYVREHGLLRAETLPLVLLAGVFSGIALWKAGSRSFVRHGLGISWTGIAFVLWQAPNARYAMGYLLLPIAIGAASWLAEFRTEPSSPSLFTLPRVGFYAAGLASVAIVLALSGVKGDDFLMPRRMARLDGDSILVVNRQTRTDARFSLSSEPNSVLRISRPFASDQCWDAEIPCTPRLTLTGIRLRDERHGYSEGFVREPGSHDDKEIATAGATVSSRFPPEGQ